MLICSFVGLISAAPSGTTVAGCGAEVPYPPLRLYAPVFVGADKRSAIRHNCCRMRRKRLIRPTGFIPDLVFVGADKRSAIRHNAALSGLQMIQAHKRSLIMRPSALSGLGFMRYSCFVGLISVAPSGITAAGCGASALSGLRLWRVFCSFVGLISAAPSGTTVVDAAQAPYPAYRL